MAIDEAIAEDLKNIKHSTFLKEIIKTDPDNLKAIAQLDMLDKGDGPGAEESSVTGQAMPSQSTGIIPAKTYGQNITVSGQGTYSKVDPNKPASVSVGPIDFKAGGSASLTFGNGEEAMKMDPDGSISFGNKMAEAIRGAVKEKGETDES